MPKLVVLALAATILAPAWLVACGTSSRTGPSVTPTPTPIPLGPLPKSVTLPKGSAAPFAIDGAILAWAGIPKEVGACPQNDVYLANTRAYLPRIIWHGPQCAVVSDVQISRSWVVWEAGASPGGSIWAHDRATGKLYRVAGQSRPSVAAEPCPTTGCFPNFAFSLAGNIVVWSETVFSSSGDFMTSSILGKVLPSGPTKLLYSTSAACRVQTQPHVAAGRLVWLEGTWTGDTAVPATPGVRECRGQLRLNVLTTWVASTFRPGRRVISPLPPLVITSSGLTQNPQTDGRYVAWLDGFGVAPTCVCADLDVYDTRTNSVTTAARSVTDYKMSGRLVTWLQLVSSGSRVQVAWVARSGLHLSRPLTIARSALAGSTSFIRTFGWPWGRRMVWELDQQRRGRYVVRAVIRDAPF